MKQETMRCIIEGSGCIWMNCCTSASKSQEHNQELCSLFGSTLKSFVIGDASSYEISIAATSRRLQDGGIQIKNVGCQGKQMILSLIVRGSGLPLGLKKVEHVFPQRTFYTI